MLLAPEPKGQRWAQAALLGAAAVAKGKDNSGSLLSKCAQLIPAPLLPAGLGSGLLKFPQLQLKGPAFPLHTSLTPSINSVPLPAHKVHTLLLINCTEQT